MASNELFKKISQLRREIRKYPLAKSGYNSFKKFNYFETKDFLPLVDDLAEQLGLFIDLNYRFKNKPRLFVYNLGGKSDYHVYYFNIHDIPKNEIQMAGGIQTYTTRYLYIQLLNLVESDSIDKNLGNPKLNKKTGSKTIKEYRGK